MENKKFELMIQHHGEKVVLIDMHDPSGAICASLVAIGIASTAHIAYKAVQFITNKIKKEND